MDLGGVLFAEGTGAFVRSFPAAQQAAVRDLLRSPAAMDLRRGRLDERTFWRGCASRLPEGWDVDRFRDGWYGAYAPNEEIFDWVRSVKGTISLTIFSGNIRSRVEWLHERNPFRDLFDEEVWSFEHGTTKPEPAFPRALLRVLGVPARDIFYIDDKPAPLAAAADLGVSGFLYSPGRVATLREEVDAFVARPPEF